MFCISSWINNQSFKEYFDVTCNSFENLVESSYKISLSTSIQEIFSHANPWRSTVFLVLFQSLPNIFNLRPSLSLKNPYLDFTSGSSCLLITWRWNTSENCKRRRKQNWTITKWILLWQYKWVFFYVPRSIIRLSHMISKGVNAFHMWTLNMSTHFAREFKTYG